MIDALAGLPDVSFIDNLTLEDVQAQMIRDYQDKYQEITKRQAVLARADPVSLILYAVSVQIYQMMLYVDRAGKMNLLKYSYGSFLDNVAALKGVSREGAKPSSTMVTFTLSETRKEPVGIPAGTRVTNGTLYFATQEYAEISPGEESIDLRCVCLTDGTEGDGLTAGELNTLVDPVPYMASVKNKEVTTGGADVESDESLAERAYLAPSGYSVAGPDDAYAYWAKTYNANISDVYVSSENPVEVLVSFIMGDGEIPNEGVIRGLDEFLKTRNIRPLTDKVTVKAPETVEYEINIKYFINISDAGAAQTIQAAVNAAVEEYIRWQRSRIGRDINPSKLTQLIINAGAKRVEVTSPVYQSIARAAVPKLREKTVNYGGTEDD